MLFESEKGTNARQVFVLYSTSDGYFKILSIPFHETLISKSKGSNIEIMVSSMFKMGATF